MRKIISILILVIAAVGIGNGDNPHVPRGPVLVSESDFLNEAGNLGSTTLFTPSASGLYRITLYSECSDEPTGGSHVAAYITWKDDFSSHQTNLGPDACPASGTYTVLATVGNDISIFTSFNIQTTGATYNTFVVVEQL